MEMKKKKKKKKKKTLSVRGKKQRHIKNHRNLDISTLSSYKKQTHKST